MPKEAKIVFTGEASVWVCTGVWVSVRLSVSQSVSQTVKLPACWCRCWHTLSQTNKLGKYEYSWVWAWIWASSYLLYVSIHS